MAQNREFVIYVGAYTRRLPHVDGSGEGIYCLRLDAEGALVLDGVAARLVNPTFLALDPVRPLLYGVSEADEAALHAFAVDAKPDGGTLTPLNRQPTGGAASCHVAVDRAGRCALTANYRSGDVTVLPIGRDGRLASLTQLVPHIGAGPNPARQAAPHPHGVYFDLTGRHLLVPDLGSDRVWVYRFAAGQPALALHDPPWAAIHPGAGPRHLVLHPNGRWIYCANELDATVSLLAFDPASGVLAEQGWVPLLPDGVDGAGSEIAIDAAGRFLYASVRRHDSIAIFAVAPDGSALTLIGHEPTRGRTPRHFALSPDGRLLVAANQDSDSLVTFRVDTETGKLTPTGHVAAVPSPACVLIFDP